MAKNRAEFNTLPVVHLGEHDFKVIDVIAVTFVNPLDHR